MVREARPELRELQARVLQIGRLDGPNRGNQSEANP